MVEVARAPATYADVLAAPEHMVAELVDGELHLQPRLARAHSVSASSLGGQLLVAFQLGRGGPGGWWIIHEPELHLGGDVVVPDIAGWRRSAVPDLDRSLAYFDEVPAWVCEVLSPSTEALDRVKKLRVYHRAGVEHAWLVHPTARTVEVYRRDAEAWTRVAAEAGAGEVALPPFEVVPLDLDTLWLGAP